MSKICPECEEPAVRYAAGFTREGWAFGPIEQERLHWMHARTHDAMCPVMTSTGYQPALPVDA
jgi:hypothetical protein